MGSLSKMVDSGEFRRRKFLGGWYTEILAPFLAAKGQLIVTNLPDASKPALAFQEKLAANPEVFGKVKVAQINPPTELILAPDNSVDLVVTFSSYSQLGQSWL